MHDGGTVICHNGSGYDHILLLDEMMKCKEMEPAEVIFNGTRLLYMELKNPVNIRFLDSYKFLSFPLSMLPSAFELESDTEGGISSNICKGFFPHMFNRKENENYIGPYPPPDAYSYGDMRPATAEKFLRWYEEKVEQNPPAVFDFKKELVQYCVNDVVILRLACIKFRTLVQDMTGVDPFGKSITLASLAMAIYRKLFVTEDFEITLSLPSGDGDVERKVVEGVTRGGRTKVDLGDGCGMRDIETLPEGFRVEKKRFISSHVGRVPPGGYRKYFHGYSRSALKWLEYCSVESGLKVYHAGNWSEVGILLQGTGVVYVDGFIPGDGRSLPLKTILSEASDGDTVLNYHGCYFHGCVTCFPLGRHLLHCQRTGRSLDEIYQQTIQRDKKLEQMGFIVITMWEHEFKNMMKEDDDVSLKVSNIPEFQEPLDPRAAFFGGRTETFTLAYSRDGDILPSHITNDDCSGGGGGGESPNKPNSCVEYVDFTSLYPDVQKNQVFPVGHPTVITTNFDTSLRSYFGLVKAKMLAPRELLFPVLPHRCGGKLLFALCRTCAERGVEDAVQARELATCSCSEEERAFVGTWVTPELHLAIEMGYTVLDVYEVYHYEQTTANTTDNFTGKHVDLFGPYVNLLLKMKTESSGFPSGCESDNQKQEYVDNYAKVEGIQLELDNIKPNKPKRLIAKVLLNSLYGKMSQRIGRTRTKIVNGRNPHELVNILTDPTIHLTDFNIVNEETLLLEYELHKEALHSGPTDNVILAAFVTAYGRIKLYSLLKKAGTRAMYADTDSLIYRIDSPEQRFPLGDYLGELTSEIPEDTNIETFLTTGPKSYAYVLSNGESVLKYKGFTLSVDAGEKMNVSSMKQMICHFANQLQDNFSEVEEVGESGGEEELVFDAEVQVSNSRIFRVKRTMSLITRKQIKQYTMTANKRIFNPNLTSIPYGFYGTF